MIENDANTAALAEARFGNGRDHQDFLYVTLGTGVGGGVIRNHQVERGPFGDAGEVGHIYVDDRVMEAHVGAPALRAAAGGRDVHEINEAAQAGDPDSVKILTTAGEMLGRGLCSAMATLGLRVVLLGGGVSQSDILVDTARNTIRAKAIPSIAAAATVSRAKFVHNTGLIGACLLVDNHTRA